MSRFVSPGRWQPASAFRVGAGVGALALLAAACGSSGQPSAAGAHSKSPMPEMSSSMPMASPSMSMGGGMLPMAAKHVMGMEATATGHYHVLLDGALVNMFCTPAAVVSLQNVKPGMHTLTVVPALDDHAQVTHNARSVMFDYAPAAPLPALTGLMTM